MKSIIIRSVPLFILCGFSACSPEPRPDPVAPHPVVCTVNYPLAWMTEQIAGDTVDVLFPEIEGDPAFWSPTAEEIGLFQGADLIILNGATYAKWLSTVSLPSSRLVDTSASFRGQWISLEAEVTHQHGPQGDHAHGDIAFTTWLNPRLAIHQAEAIGRALSDRWPENANRFAEGLAGVKEQLEELDADLEKVFSGLQDTPLAGSHPVYQYLAARYQLPIRQVHWEPDLVPTSDQWKNLEDLLREHPARVMLWEDEPLPETRSRLLERGLQSIVFSPCGNRPAQGDYLSVMKGNLEALQNGL